MFEELLKQVAVALERAGLPYMVFGGQAVLKNRGFDRAYVERWLQQFDEGLSTDFLRVFQDMMARLAS